MRKGSNTWKLVSFFLMMSMGACLFLGGIERVFSQDLSRQQEVMEVPFVRNRISVNGILDEWKEYKGIKFSPLGAMPGSSSGAWVRCAWDEDCVDFGAPVIPLGDFTVSVWIKCDDVEKLFFLGQYCYKDPKRLDLVIREGRVLIQIAEKLSSEVLIKKDRWYHLVYARKGKVMSIFVDGVLVKNGRLPMAVMQDASLIAGRIEIPRRGNFRFTGVMDELRIHEGALNVKRVKALFAARRID